MIDKNSDKETTLFTTLISDKEINNKLIRSQKYM